MSFEEFQEVYICIMEQFECPEYSPELYEKIMNVEETHNQFFRAAQGILYGEDGVNQLCWECNTRVENRKVQVCSRCKCAQYCGRECQKKSWQSGHKAVYNLLARVDKWLEENMELCERASPVYRTSISICTTSNMSC